MSELYEFWDAPLELKTMIASGKRRGMVDCHGHPYTEGTLTRDQYSRLSKMSLEEKWKEADGVRGDPATLVSFPARLTKAIRDRMEQGIRAARFYIDIGPSIGTQAIDIAVEAKKSFAREGFYLQIAAYPMQGMTREEETDILTRSCARPEVEVIGCTPSRGRKGIGDIKTSRERMNFYAKVAYKHNKILDAHLDQKNHPEEIETAEFTKVVKKLRKKGYDKPVGATHCISISAWDDMSFILKVLREMKALGITLIICPGSNINNEQLKDIQAYTHNSIAPWNIAIEEGVNVAFGIDNIRDLYMPLCDGDVSKEVSALINGVRWQGGLEMIADIFTTNGWKALQGI
jgi:cytosine/creatinine deaminase